MSNSKKVYGFCKSCKENLKFAPLYAAHEWLCKECYAEKFEDKIPGPSSAFEHGTGGGKRVVRDPKGLS